ncbi:hypothetical protein [Roseimicrobium sp. ORNL1]|uniref:hypothetical protein n=1 Tax=Roseimicrobium sp. ORNL1 TaxID=2711231 RepID=UPI0013E1354A|nr:hypothetical protein [Roseimicrobium sp. ORNL1]QIF05497.1 hypothetical protein G5S37_29695 [Roseimicrobium sp. ORNL1]
MHTETLPTSAKERGHSCPPRLMHQLPAFQWSGQASPRLYLRDMEGGLFPPARDQQITPQTSGQECPRSCDHSEADDLYFFSHYAALAA